MSSLLAFLALLGAPAEPVTVMGRTVLAESDLVARGAPIEFLRLGHGAVVVRFEIREVLAGREEEKVVLVMTNDPDWFGPVETPCIAFLSRRDADRYEGVARVDLTGAEAADRREVLERYLRIEARPDAETRETELRACLMEHLAAGGRFKRWSAARELAHFTGRAPKRFTEADRAAIRAAREGARDPLLRGLLAEALTNLGAPVEIAPAAPDPGGPDVRDEAGLPAPREFREMFAEWREKPKSPERRLAIVVRTTSRHAKFAKWIVPDALGDPDGLVREAAARGAGEALLSDLAPALRDLLAGDPETGVRGAALRSLGILKDQEALPLVIRAGEDPRLLIEAMFAAARIGGDLAKDWFATLAAVRRSDSEADREVRRLLEFFAGDDFLRQEEAFEKLRRERLR